LNKNTRIKSDNELISASLDSEDISLLNQLSDKQKDQALTLYTAREKKKSTAYILWIDRLVY
jgi:hypothetical protein